MQITLKLCILLKLYQCFASTLSPDLYLVRQLLSKHLLRDVRFNWVGLFKQVLALQEILHAAMEHVAHPVYSVLLMQTTRLMLAA